MVASLFLATLLTISGFAAAEPRLSPQVVHERRTVLPSGWTATARADPAQTLAFRFGLAQSNLDRLDEYLNEVAHPESPLYGEHWTAERVANTFAPSKDTVDTVRAWLHTAGVHPDRIRQTAGKVWLELNATIAEAETLLSTKYKVYQHESGASRIGCEKYHVPAHVQPHVDVITPSLHFDTKLHGRDVPGGRAAKIGQPGVGSVEPHFAGTVKNLIDELDNCDTHITPNCLRALYGILYEPLATNKNSYGIVEYTPQAYVKSDLDMFYRNFSKNLVGKYPKTVSIDGGVVQTTETGFSFNGESNLDLQYAQALVQRQDLTLYQVGDVVEGASFNDFLDAIDGSYCSFEGGDDPDQDAVYPDPSNAAGSYKGSKNCGTTKPAYVISTSYGYDEADLTPFYAQRQCAEYAKLGLMGTTIVYSSGDYGVAGNGGLCLNPDGSQSKSGKRFNPSFPASCPYVTAIGATQLPAGKKVTDRESATYEVIFSGGGFSNYFTPPAYQKAAVASYFQNYKPSYSANLYNASGRGFPDISANGANYVVAVDGNFSRVFGTSASAPVIGAMISNINDARLAIGKKPLGFINPALYSPGFQVAYNPVTNGTNQGCGTQGFSAVSGWDPVTGLGTPRFPILLAKFLAL